MKKILYIIFIIFLVSCEMEVSGNIYLQDLIDTIQNPQENFYTEANVAFEILSDKDKEKYMNFISNHFKDAKNFRIESRGLKTFIYADIKIPIVLKKNDSQHLAHLISIIVDSIQENEIDFGIYLNKDKFKQLQDYVQEEYLTNLSISDLKIYTKIMNNTKSDATIHLTSVYANQEPVPFPKEFSLKKRDTINIEISNVLRDYIYENDTAIFAKFKNYQK